MTLADWARQRRRNWKEEGKAEARQEMREAQLGLREQFLREQIDKVLADATLTPEQKNHFIGILNAR